jgi:hypothetical protein
VERYVPKPFLGSLGEGKGGGHTSDCSIPHKCGAYLDKSLDNFSCMCATASRPDLECHPRSRGYFADSDDRSPWPRHGGLLLSTRQLV